MGIQGPGGYGKSTLLRKLAQEGWDTHDDAHLAAPSRLDELRDKVEAGSRLAIAFRPWPRPPSLVALIEALRRHGRVVVLTPLRVAPEVYEQTLGVPRFVERFTQSPSREAALHQFLPELEALEPEVLQALLAATVGSLSASADVLAAAKATGLLGQDGAMAPLARDALLRLSPAPVRDAVLRRVASIRLERASPLLPMIRLLREAGISLPMGSAAAEEAIYEDPALAASLFAEVDGADPVRHAYAAALAGDIDTALRLTDRALATSPSPDAADIAAAAFAHRGQLARSAALYQFSGDPALHALAALASGTVPAVPPAPGLVTSLASATTLMADGVRESLDGAGAGALPLLVQAGEVLAPSGRCVLLPDTPAALAALVALHCGEYGSAESVLDGALASGLGGPVFEPRHRLLRAWITMVRQGLRDPVPAVTEPRDALFATALEVGIARRASDLAALQVAFKAACDTLLRHPVDLFMLLPLGELVIAAARLGELPRLAPRLDEVRLLLDRLGRPALWATPWHWACFQAGIVPDDALASSLGGTASTRFGSALAAAAAQWTELGRGTVDPGNVEAAARGLHAVGLSWDGARLAGQAAIRTADRRAMTALLDCARMLQGKRRNDSRASSVATDVAGAGVRLSEREQEVADLVVAGHTYKQIAGKLFISAKTVEHHVARMRQRLNCQSRSELLARLRAMQTSMQTTVPRPRQPVE